MGVNGKSSPHRSRPLGGPQTVLPHLDNARCWRDEGGGEGRSWRRGVKSDIDPFPLRAHQGREPRCVVRGTRVGPDVCASRRVVRVVLWWVVRESGWSGASTQPRPGFRRPVPHVVAKAAHHSGMVTFLSNAPRIPPSHRAAPRTRPDGSARVQSPAKVVTPASSILWADGRIVLRVRYCQYLLAWLAPRVRP